MDAESVTEGSGMCDILSRGDGRGDVFCISYKKRNPLRNQQHIRC